jgi:uncharacterized membrane protein
MKYDLFAALLAPAVAFALWTVTHDYPCFARTPLAIGVTVSIATMGAVIGHTMKRGFDRGRVALVFEMLAMVWAYAFTAFRCFEHGCPERAAMRVAVMVYIVNIAWVARSATVATRETVDAWAGRGMVEAWVGRGMVLRSGRVVGGGPPKRL